LKSPPLGGPILHAINGVSASPLALARTTTRATRAPSILAAYKLIVKEAKEGRLVTADEYDPQRRYCFPGVLGRIHQDCSCFFLLSLVLYRELSMARGEVAALASA
jgi:hypothetical protein